MHTSLVQEMQKRKLITYQFPYRVYDVARRRVASTNDQWEPIDRFRACEINNENVHSIVDLQVKSIQRCQLLCQAAKHCEAIDWFNSSSWCALYKKPCTKPLQEKHGASSYRIKGTFFRVSMNKFARVDRTASLFSHNPPPTHM